MKVREYNRNMRKVILSATRREVKEEEEEAFISNLWKWALQINWIELNLVLD